MEKTIEFACVADIYDEYVQTTTDIPFFLEEAAKVSGEVLELMSGTGRVSIPLLQSGVRLTCVDYSEEMLERLKEKLRHNALSATIHHMDVREMDLGKKFELILLPFNSFSELPSPEDQQRALHCIHEHLASNGRFICTLHNPPVRLRKVDGQLRLWGKHTLPVGTLLFWGMEEWDAQSGLVNGIELFEEYNHDGFLQRKRLMELRFRIVEKDDFERIAGSAGFEIEALYGDYMRNNFSETSSPFMIWKLHAGA